MHTSQVVRKFALKAGDLLLELSHLLLLGKFFGLPLDNRVVLIIIATVTIVPSISVQVHRLPWVLLSLGLKLVSCLLVWIRQLLLLHFSESLVLVPSCQAHCDQEDYWRSKLHPVSSLVGVGLLIQSVLDQDKALTSQNEFESVCCLYNRRQLGATLADRHGVFSSSVRSNYEIRWNCWHIDDGDTVLIRNREKWSIPKVDRRWSQILVKTYFAYSRALVSLCWQLKEDNLLLVSQCVDHGWGGVVESKVNDLAQYSARLHLLVLPNLIEVDSLCIQQEQGVGHSFNSKHVFVADSFGLRLSDAISKERSDVVVLVN